MSELKKCPACGGEAFIFTHDQGDYIDYTPYYDVECKVCHISSTCEDTKAQAVEAWNNQPRIEELTELLRNLYQFIEGTIKQYDESDIYSSMQHRFRAIESKYQQKIKEVLKDE